MKITITGMGPPAPAGPRPPQQPPTPRSPRSQTRVRRAPCARLRAGSSSPRSQRHPPLRPCYCYHVQAPVLHKPVLHNDKVFRIMLPQASRRRAPAPHALSVTSLCGHAIIGVLVRCGVPPGGRVRRARGVVFSFPFSFFGPGPFPL